MYIYTYILIHMHYIILYYPYMYVNKFLGVNVSICTTVYSTLVKLASLLQSIKSF